MLPLVDLALMHHFTVSGILCVPLTRMHEQSV